MVGDAVVMSGTPVFAVVEKMGSVRPIVGKLVTASVGNTRLVG